MAEKYDCPVCKKQVTATKNNRYRSHSNDGEVCEMSSAEIPEHILANPVGKDDAPDVPREGIDFALCPQCDRKVKLTRLGYFEPHNETLMGGERCPTSGVRAKNARKTETVPLPGDEPLPASAAVPAVKDSARPVVNRGLALTAAPAAPTTTAGEDAPKTTDAGSPTPPSGPSAEAPPATGGSSSQESASTSKDSSEGSSASSTSSDAEEGGDADVGPFQLAPNLDDKILQPFSHILQPFPVPPRLKLAESMSERGKEIAARLRETFYAYTNRDSSDNRSAQKTLGPSEVGSPCDRQIAMKLLGIEPVNPQEGWAPFVGSAVHAELAKMFDWANGSGSGRYVTEMPVSFGHPLVPRGTLDLLDRVLFMVDDHKLMGRWSLDQLIQKGPSETYRKQIQVYGLGAELAGEKVKEVAIIGWPRQESSLDKLYVHVEKYDRKIAQEALARVTRIAEEVERRSQPMHPDGERSAARPLEVAAGFPPGDDCKWCPFHLKNDKEFKRGCPGK